MPNAIEGPIRQTIRMLAYRQFAIIVMEITKMQILHGAIRFK